MGLKLQIWSSLIHDVSKQPAMRDMIRNESREIVATMTVRKEFDFVQQLNSQDEQSKYGQIWLHIPQPWGWIWPDMKMWPDFGRGWIYLVQR